MPGPRKWQNRLHGHGRRWTAPRETILGLLSGTSQHLSAKQIYVKLHKMNPAIGLTTVYRTLDLLVNMGLLNKLTLGASESRYEFKSEKEDTHHHHLICTKCGKIIDYSDFVNEELELIKKTEKILAKNHSFKIFDHNIEFYGLCQNCAKSKENK